MVKNLSCVSYGSLKHFPHTFTTDIQINIPQNSTPVARNAVSILELISKYRTNILEVFTRANTHVRPYIARLCVHTLSRNSLFDQRLGFVTASYRPGS